MRVTLEVSLAAFPQPLYEHVLAYVLKQSETQPNEPQSHSLQVKKKKLLWPLYGHVLAYVLR